MNFRYKSAYLKAFDKLSFHEQQLALQTDQAIKKYFQTFQAPFGLRIKNLYQNIFEARLNDKLRIVWVKQEQEIIFSLLGNHEEIKRFIKRL